MNAIHIDWSLIFAANFVRLVIDFPSNVFILWALTKDGYHPKRT